MINIVSVIKVAFIHILSFHGNQWDETLLAYVLSPSCYAIYKLCVSLLTSGIKVAPTPSTLLGEENVDE